MSNIMTTSELAELIEEYPDLGDVTLNGSTDYTTIANATFDELDNQYIWDIIRALKGEKPKRSRKR